MARALFPSLQRWWRRVRTPGVPRIEVFTATRLPVTEGGVVTLLWRVVGAASVRIEPGLGEVPPHGALRTRVLPADGRYELVADARGGTARAACRIRGPVALADALEATPAGTETVPAPGLARARVRFAGSRRSATTAPDAASHSAGDVTSAPTTLLAPVVTESGAPVPHRRRAAAVGLASRPDVPPPSPRPAVRPRTALRAVAAVPPFDPRELPA